MSSRTNEQTHENESLRDAGLRVRRVERRGSALVLVVGTLALIAVFAAFYVTLGQADTRVSRGVEQGGAIEEVERQFAEHIAGVVGRDRTATFVETITENEQLVGDRIAPDNQTSRPATAADRQRFVREVTDYPYTDYSKVSILSDGSGTGPQDAQLRFVPQNYLNKPQSLGARIPEAVERYRFRAEGDESFQFDLPGAFDQLNLQGSADALADRRVASDPWLAPNEPTFTGRFDRNQPVSFHDSRIFSSAALSLAGGVSQEELFYLDNRDWAQISNPAPDGLSVNLWNLRNNFDAESGLGVDASGRPRMSENRTLLTIAQDGTFRLRATDRLHIDPLGNSGTPSIVGTDPNNPNANPFTFAIKNTPAWWTMNQRFLYFPADPSFQILGRNVDGNGRPINTQFLTPQTPERPDFPDLQYADADGDGFYDSRWYELRDSTLGPGGVLDLLANETGMRFFFAPRIIDLSAKVNVNSATDALVPPTSEVPGGATPAEIDLRRQLTMEDAAERFAPVFQNPNAQIGNQRLSYAHIQRLPFSEAQINAGGRLVAADYERYATGFDTSVNLGNGIFPLTGNGIASGRFAYDAIRRAIQGDEIALPTGVTDRRATTPVGSVVAPLVESSAFEYYLFDPTLAPNARNIRADAGLGVGSELNYTPATLAEIRAMPAARRDYWHFVGGANIADPADPPLTALGVGGNLFGLDDLSELLTFYGLNDDRVLSRLERVTQGRFDSAVIADGTTRYGPLRANRPTALERRFHDDRINIINPNSGNAGIGSDGRIDYESMALLALNPRLRLTTLSGAAPLRSRIVEDTNGDGILSADEKRLTSADARLDLTADPSAVDLFGVYAEALLPYSAIDTTWAFDPDGDSVLVGPHTAFDYNQYRTLAYGHRGSELALRLSAHLAVNMADQLDDDDIPSAMTVLAAGAGPASATGLSNGWRRTNLDTQAGAPQDAVYPWWVQNDRFDLGDDRLAPESNELDITGGGNLSRQVYNVFGLEPQPFITEVALVTVYNDTPRTLLNSSPINGGYRTFDPTDLAEGESEGATLPQGVPGGNYEDPIGLAYNGAFANALTCGIGADDGLDDNILIQYDASPNNPDLMLQVLAVQLTNPFDVPINLTDTAPAFDDTQVPFDDRNGEPLPGGNPNQLQDIRYYIEYNGHFFALADLVENPLLTQGIYDEPQQANQLHRVILQPGESRVFYVSAHPNLTDLSVRWRQVIEAYPNLGDLGESFAVSDAIPTTAVDPDLVQKFIHDQFAVRRSARDVSDPTLPVDPDVSLPVRMVPFNPETGAVRPAGTNESNLDPVAFVDVTRTNLQFRQYGPNANDYARLRQEVRLWRKMTVDEDSPIGGDEGTTYQGQTFQGVNDPGQNWIGNDLLVDRLRDPVLETVASQSNEAALDYATMQPDRIQTRVVGTDFYQPDGQFGFFDFDQPTVRDERSIPLTMSTDDTIGGWSLLGGTNQGATIVRWAGYRRPDHLEEPIGDGLLNEKDRSPRGLLPAWCLEGVGTNHNIATPTLDNEPDGIAALNRIQNQVIDAQFQAGGFAGELFGFRGCHGLDPGDNNDTRGMFFMNFRRFMLEHVPVRLLADAEGTPILQNQGINGQVKFDPMLIPTITRHPALKYRRVELINEINDFNGLGAPEEFQDPLDHRTIFRSEIPGNLQFEPTDKRTIARLDADPEGEPRDIIAELPIVLSMGDDGLGAGDQPRFKPIRVGDLLTPFAFGAVYKPFDPLNRLPRNFLAQEWMTFAEAASAGLGFEPASFYTLEPDQDGWDLLSETLDNKGRRDSRQIADSLQVSTQIYERMSVLDFGRLDLHAFTPFVNRTEPLIGTGPGALLASEPQFDPAGDPLSGTLLGSDTRVGLAEPPAQRLLSLATALSRGGDPLTTPLIGTVNLNTAPDTVLRSVPGFATPLQFSAAGIEYDRYNADGTNIVPNGELLDWGAGRVAGKTPLNFREPLPANGEPWTPPFGVGDPFGDYDQAYSDWIRSWKNVSDVPASLLAWRDRTRGAFRRPARVNPAVGQGGFTVQARQPESVFDYTPNRSILNGFIASPPIWAPGTDQNDILSLSLNNFATDYARNALSGQNASSEQPGLSGIGSVLGLTVTRFDPLANNPQIIANPRLQDPTNPAASNYRVSVYEAVPQGTTTRLAIDEYAMEAIDQDENGEADTNPLAIGDEVILVPNDPVNDDNFSYTLGRGRYLNENPDLLDRSRSLEDEVVDDILEELAVLNGAANTVDVRSDFFAAWFLVRGYREDDVEGLEPGEPMRPTYEKRFLMVLDRSNVTESGELPRVLFIREVPL